MAHVAWPQTEKLMVTDKKSFKDRIVVWIGKKLLGVEQYRYSISLPGREIVNGQGLFMDNKSQKTLQFLLNSKDPTFSIFQKV